MIEIRLVGHLIRNEYTKIDMCVIIRNSCKCADDRDGPAVR